MDDPYPLSLGPSQLALNGLSARYGKRLAGQKIQLPSDRERIGGRNVGTRLVSASPQCIRLAPGGATAEGQGCGRDVDPE